MSDFQVKWLRLKGETVFIVLSTDGFQLYDAEVTGIKFAHRCKDLGHDKGVVLTLSQNAILLTAINII